VNEDTLLKSLSKWVATRPDEVVLDPKKGFYSFDIVMDAYNKGKETGEGNLKQYFRDVYYQRFQLTTESILAFYTNLLEKKYSPKKLFINFSLNQCVVLITITPEVHADDKFIDYAYGEALTIQAELSRKDVVLSINFVSEFKDNINLESIKSDGFDFAYDFEKNQAIV